MRPDGSAAADDRGAVPDNDRSAPGETLAEVLSASIVARATTLAHLRRQLVELGTPVSLTALSYWRSGQRRPETASSRLALGNLESLLELPTGRLTQLVDPPRRSEPAPGAAVPPPWPVTPTDRLLAGLGFTVERGMADQSLQHVLDVDADGCPFLLRVRGLHRATRDGVDRRAIGLSISHPDGEPRPIVALAGGTIGRTAEDLGQGVYVAEFLFDRALRVGETVVIEYQVTIAPASERFYELTLGPRLRHAMVWVRFHPDRLPRRVETYRDVRGGRRSREIDMAGTTSVHHAVDGGGPGLMGIRWSWDETLPPTP